MWSLQRIRCVSNLPLFRSSFHRHHQSTNLHRTHNCLWLRWSVRSSRKLCRGVAVPVTAAVTVHSPPPPSLGTQSSHRDRADATTPGYSRGYLTPKMAAQERDGAIQTQPLHPDTPVWKHCKSQIQAIELTTPQLDRKRPGPRCILNHCSTINLAQYLR